MNAITIPLPTPRAGARTPPADLQWMPPGEHTINGSQNGDAVERTVQVDADTAERMQGALEEMLSAATRGEGDRPYFDFNHDDGPASAWPREFYWAGDNPQTGGVRARLEWSALGREAVLGRTFRRFSPSFFVDESGVVTGAPVNMGGLVNRAAFRGIQPIWTKESPQPNPTMKDTHPSMKSLLALAAKLGFVADADVDEATAIVQFNAKASALLGAGAELATLRAQLQNAQDDAIRARQAHAQSVVEQAALDGRIPPRNEAVRARWTKLIEDDPANAALLPEPNPALRTVVSARQAQATPPSSAAAPAEHSFLAKARELAREKSLSEADAVIACGWRHPALYEEYRAALLADPSNAVAA